MNQVNAVLMTYWRRATVGLMPWVLGLLAVIVALQMVNFGRREPSSFAWMALYFTIPLALFIKQQMVVVRERILPGSIHLHLFVGMAFVALFGVLLPMSSMLINGHWSLGYAGLCVAISGLMFAVFETNSKWLIPFCLMPLFGFLGPVRNGVQALWSGELEFIGVLLLMTGIGSFAYSIYWLLTAVEEDPGYYIGTSNRGGIDWFRPNAASMVQNDAVKEFWRRRRGVRPRDPSPRAIAAWPALARGTLLQQIQLWSLPRGAQQALRFAAVFPSMMIIMQLVLGMPFNNLMSSPMFLMPAYMIAMMPIHQRSYWAMEILRPVSRERFFLLAGLAMCLSGALTYAVTVMITVGGAFIFWPALVTPDLAVRFALVTAIGQLWLVTLAIWLARHRSKTFLILAYILSLTGFAIFSMSTMQRAKPDLESLVLVLAISCLFCVVILCDAYRRWLRVEIG